MRRFRAFPLAIGVVVLGGCLGERSGGVRRVSVDPDVVNFSRQGDQLILAGRVYRGNVLATDSSRFAWRATDSTIADVTPDGVVTARGDGVTRIWGVSGTDSAFAVVVVQVPVAPVVVTVAPGRLQFSALTAAAQLNVSSSDTLTGDSVPVCHTDDPRVAVVESLTVRARGNGTTRVRCAIAGVEGSNVATVIIRQRIVRVRLTTDRDLAMRVGRDSLNFALARVDSLRQPVARGTARFVSLDTGIVQVDPAQGTVVALALGTGRIVGSVEGLADTAVIRVVDIAAPTANVTVRRAGGAAGSSTRRPGVRTVGRAGASRSGPAAFQLGARDFQDRDSIFQGGTVATARPSRWTPRVIVALAERRGDLGQDTGFLLERATGVIAGIEMEATPSRRLRFLAKGLGGKLTAKGTGETGTVAEAQLDVGLAVFPWLWFQVGGGRRTFKDQLDVISHLTSVRTGGEARFGLGKGGTAGFIKMAWPFFVDLAPKPAPRPSLSFAMEAGVDGRTGIFTAGVHYALERFDFPPPTVGVRKREQFATLRVRMGLEFGR